MLIIFILHTKRGLKFRGSHS